VKIQKIMPFIFAVAMQVMAILLFVNSYIMIGILVQFLASVLFVAFGIFLGEN
jgi:hypothetical protein